MDLLTIYKSRDFGTLEAAVRAGAEAALAAHGGGTLSMLDLIAVCASTPEHSIVCNRQTLAHSRQFEVVEVRPSIQERVHGPPACSIEKQGSEHWLYLDEKAAIFCGEGHPGTWLATAARHESGCVLMLSLKVEPATAANDEALHTALIELTQAAGEALPPILASERFKLDGETLAAVSASITELLTGTDEAALHGALIEQVHRHFSFRRIYLALHDVNSKSYRCKLHTGFDSSFTPFAVALSEEDDFFVKIVREGTPRFITRADEPASDLGRFDIGEDFCGAIVIPLNIGSLCVGFIYADRPRGHEAFIMREAVTSFGALSAGAITALGERMTVQHQAETDSLTGCHNRYFLDRVLEVEIPRVRRYNSPISMLMLDLCDFKRTNDLYGHVFGDYILRETAGIIQTCVRELDIVVRYGGDEFVVLMVNTSEELARRVQDRIEQAFINRNGEQDEERMMIDISIGLRSANAETISTLLAEADADMYLNKAERKKRQLTEALLELPGSRSDSIDVVISSLLANLNKKEPYNPIHSRRVAHLCLLIASELDLAAGDVISLVLAAMLHDVGKASLPVEMLQREGPLTDSERRAVRAHSIVGEEFFKGLAHLEDVRPIIRHHHERFDGDTSGDQGGYPYGLKGKDIPLGARVLKLADSMDSLLAGRPYREAWTLDKALGFVREQSGGAFDPALVKTLLRLDGWAAKLDSAQALADLYARVMEEAEDAGPDVIEAPGAVDAPRA